MSETTTLQAKAYTQGGTPRDAVALPATPFDGTVHAPAMHQAVKAHLANRRQGTHATKTRHWVTGGNQKPWKQKGTGRARQGSSRAPHWPGGGTVFGPQPRSYAQDLPKAVKALARKSALNARAKDGMVLVIDRFTFEAPRSSAIARLVARLGLAERKVLILTDGLNRTVYLSGRNLPNVHVVPFAEASTYDVLWSHAVLVEAGAIGQQLAPVAEAPEASGETAAPKAKQASEKSAAKSAAKASAKSAAAKPAAKPATKTAAAKAEAPAKAETKSAPKATPRKKTKE